MNKIILVLAIIFLSSCESFVKKSHEGQKIDSLYVEKYMWKGYAAKDLTSLKSENIDVKSEVLSTEDDSIRYVFDNNKLILAFNWPSKKDLNFHRRYFLGNIQIKVKRIFFVDSFKIDLDQIFIDYKSPVVKKLEKDIYIIISENLTATGYGANFSLYQILDINQKVLYESYLFNQN